MIWENEAYYISRERLRKKNKVAIVAEGLKRGYVDPSTCADIIKTYNRDTLAELLARRIGIRNNRN